MYLTFIRHLVEYSCKVWNNCTAVEQLEKVQQEAACMIASYASILSIYIETGWVKLCRTR